MSMSDQKSTYEGDKPSTETSNSSYLQNQLLIAMPNLDDPYFKQSVTLICQHGADGCFGLTINKPIEITVDEVLKQLDMDVKEGDSTSVSAKNIKLNAPQSLPALRGGPVQVEQGFIIHDSDQEWGNTLTIDEDLYVTASQDILVDIAAGNGPENYLLALGCASWEAGQIEAEILNNSWLNCPVDKKLIFNLPFEKRWQGAADTLGINLCAMSGLSGHD